MSRASRARRLLREQQGASTVVVALCMTVLLIVVALVVDVGATAARKAQLQDAADAAAIAIAQACHDSEATRAAEGCDPLVRAGAAELAAQIARDTMNDGLADLQALPDFAVGTESVQVRLSSPQASLFSWSAGEDGAVVLASATAEWQRTVALPLAVNSCVVPDPDAVDGVQFIGTGLYTGVQDLLNAVVGALGRDLDLPGYLENIFGCGVSVLAGGWLGTGADCSYDPVVLLSTLSSTVERLLPVNQVVPDLCSSVISSMIGQRIIVPVFEHATGQTVSQLLGFSGEISFTEIVVSGYEFDGILGLGDLERFPDGGPRCATSLGELLGLGDDGLSGLLTELGSGPLRTLLELPVVAQIAAFLGLDAVLGFLGDLLWFLNPVGDLVDAVLDVLLPVLDLCQGVQGTVVATGLSAEQASERLAAPVRLIA